MRASTYYVDTDDGEGSAKSVHLRTGGKGVATNMYVHTTTAPMNLTTPKILLFFPQAIFNVQYADIGSASEFENLDYIFRPKSNALFMR